MNQIPYYTLQFLLGGASVIGITAIAKYVHPKYAGILYALPVILILAMIFIYVEKGSDVAKQTLRSALIYEFTLLYFVVAFYFLLEEPVAECTFPSLRGAKRRSHPYGRSRAARQSLKVHGIATPRPRSGLAMTMRSFSDTPLSRIGFWGSLCSSLLTWLFIVFAIHFFV